ncbi:MAG TPA: CaiB/BaiF CoA-transferase family protein [Flavobacteriales bacterium]|jgi:crotonobetainyl-CoA:carnitine CoA-transferase CaiB-like acyl-CoA transferase|nr:CoA transferase [Flavobacteriales bacterium]MBK7100735.1 CoA transferase [Flavobacteriales bacterium]MBK7484218.1 CoA transferase [Flavobacteriales bacterium]MBK7618288.1 CoA transferase [Flavobacteriales bacterium]MBK8709179.1 CoA transferase [Flavobacteriales bacterium]
MLEDLLVIETAAVLAGPAVGMHFAELGARVIKIENKRSGGDVTRKWKLPTEDPNSPVSAYFSSVNWGKEHRMLNLTDVEDQKTFDILLIQADVLITNHLEADAEKLGLSRERVQALNPTLIHGHIKGFAAQPQRPAFDVVLQAETGYISMTGTADHPAKLPIALIDVLAAHQLKQGILLALWQRDRTGKGAYVEVSLEAAALSGLINQASNFLMAEAVAKPLGTLHPNIAPYGELFTCADGGRIILAVGSDAQFAALCTTLGQTTLAMDPRFVRNTDRVMNRVDLAALLARSIATHARDELLGALLKAQVPAGAVNDIREALATPLAQRMTLTSEIDGKPTRRIRGNAFRIEPY